MHAALVALIRRRAKSGDGGQPGLLSARIARSGERRDGIAPARVIHQARQRMPRLNALPFGQTTSRPRDDAAGCGTARREGTPYVLEL